MQWFLQKYRITNVLNSIKMTNYQNNTQYVTSNATVQLTYHTVEAARVLCKCKQGTKSEGK